MIAISSRYRYGAFNTVFVYMKSLQNKSWGYLLLIHSSQISAATLHNANISNNVICNEQRYSLMFSNKINQIIIFIILYCYGNTMNKDFLFFVLFVCRIAMDQLYSLFDRSYVEINCYILMYI